MNRILLYFRDIWRGGSLLGGLRSSRWASVRAEHLRKFPVCAVCRTRKNLEAHHLVAFHTNPELELEPQNIISLCTPHHLTFGHLQNYQSINPDCKEDARIWNKKILQRLR